MPAMENIFTDKENFPPELDSVEHLESLIENGEENCVTRVKVLAENTLADLIAQKNELEEIVREKFETRLQLEKEADVRRNHTNTLRQQTKEVEAENTKLLEKLEALKTELAGLKEQRANLPILGYQEQHQYVVSQMSNLENIAAMFSKFKSKDAIENSFNTLTIQIEQQKKKCTEDEQKVSELQKEIENLNKQIRCHPIKSLEAISAALKRDLADANVELRMQR